MKLRVYQGLVKAGVVKSKKEALELVKAGNVRVNSVTVNSLDYFYDTKRDVLFLNDKIIKTLKEKIYLLFNKPRGVETSKENLLSYLDFSNDIKKTIFPIGRLDKDSEGLIILTNDGDLTNLILEPIEKVEKTYLIKVKEEITDSSLERLKEGIEIELEEDGAKTLYTTLPCKIKKIEDLKYEIKITEGKKRQIRRMLESILNKVIDLKRIAIGRIELSDIKPGEYRSVLKEEIISKLK